MVSGKNVIVIAVFCLFVIAITGFVLLTPKKTDLAGGTCGTVTPGYNDACCEQRNKDTIHIQCVGQWKYSETGDPKTECSWECTTEQSKNCTKEGESYVVYPASLSCCEGLTPISCSKPFNDTCPSAICIGASICTKCGDGVCGPGENKCNCPEDCVEQDSFIGKDLVIATNYEIFKLSYNPVNKKYEKRRSLKISDLTPDNNSQFIGITEFDNHVLVSTDSTLFKVDSSFNQSFSRNFGKIDAFASNESHIFISSNGSFIVLDENLSELGRTAVDINKKNLHDILIYNQTAYVLDNVRLPLYIFKIDLKDLKKPTVREKIQFFGVNAHLGTQWLVPELNAWFILEDSGGSNGPVQNVRVFLMENTTVELTESRASPLCTTDYDARGQNGYCILGITQTSPIWAVVRYEEENQSVYLAQVNSRSISSSVFPDGEDRIHFWFSKTILLDTPKNYSPELFPVLLHKSGNYLFITSKYSNDLTVIDISGDPRIVLKKDVGEYKSVYNVVGVIQLEDVALPGVSCGTVTPESRDECCAERNKNISMPGCSDSRAEWRYRPSNDTKTECVWYCVIREGGQIGQVGNQYRGIPIVTVCEDNLTIISCTKLYYDACMFATDCGICANCGNGICGKGENKCNCPKDCNKMNDSGATASGVKNAVDANNQFAFELYSKIKTPSNQNLLFSPYSISSALAITYEGARGGTADEIQGVFHFPKDDSVRRPAFARLYNAINAPNSAYELRTANALWVEKTYPFLLEYTTVASQYYGASATNLDFIRGTESSRVTINNWVEAQTNGKIKDLIPRGAIDSMTRLVITNAVYFKGKWAEQFNETFTKEEDFSTAENKKVKVQMMRLDETTLNYSESGDLQVLELPYEGGDLSMLLLLPKDNNLDALESSLSAEKLSELRASLHEEKVYVHIPRFKFETTYDLGSKLSAMGMPRAFTSAADFSGMDGTRDLSISKVIHKAFIEVNEEGTEAAAATAVIIRTGSMPYYKTFRADHPFVFVIQEKKTGAVLFVGRVADPTRS